MLIACVLFCLPACTSLETLNQLRPGYSYPLPFTPSWYNRKAVEREFNMRYRSDEEMRQREWLIL